MRRQHPRLVVQVVRANTAAEQQRELRERKIEFTIGRIGPSLDRDEFETEILIDEQLFVVAGAHNPWTRRRRVELAELVDQAWVWPSPESASGQVAAEVFRASGLAVPRATVVTTTFQLSRPLLEEGPFLSFMPASVLALLSKHSELRVVPIGQVIRSEPVGLVKLRKRTLSSLAQLFIDVSRSFAKPGVVLEVPHSRSKRRA